MLNLFKRTKKLEDTVIIGIAGTRGKTTLLHTVHSVLTQLGFKSTYISSNGYSADGKTFNNDHTANNMDAVFLQKFIKTSLKNNAQFILVEVTTAGILRGVYNETSFNSGLITNMFYDDDEFYSSLEKYAETKIGFINSIKNQGVLVTFNHSDFFDKWLNEIGNKIENEIYSVVMSPENFRNISHTLNSLNYVYDDVNISAPLIGDFHVVNTAMTMKLLENYMDRDIIIESFKTLEGVEGRMEAVVVDPFTVVIDYAYRSEMIEDALKYLKSIKNDKAKIITVMGINEYGIPSRLDTADMASKLSDLVILTAEDPGSLRVFDLNNELQSAVNSKETVLLQRFENSQEYSEVNLFGLKSKISSSQKKEITPFICFDADDYTSRIDAIDLAIKLANDGDIIYICGKGHEKTINFGNTEYNWSDHEAVRIALATKL